MGWVAPSAIAPLAPLADGLPDSASAATAAEGLGKGDKGAAAGRDLKKAAVHRTGRGFGKKPGADAGGDGA